MARVAGSGHWGEGLTADEGLGNYARCRTLAGPVSATKKGRRHGARRPSFPAARKPERSSLLLGFFHRALGGVGRFLGGVGRFGGLVGPGARAHRCRGLGMTEG